jgi:hypothetical protein
MEGLFYWVEYDNKRGGASLSIRTMDNVEFLSQYFGVDNRYSINELNEKLEKIINPNISEDTINYANNIGSGFYREISFFKSLTEFYMNISNDEKHLVFGVGYGGPRIKLPIDNALVKTFDRIGKHLNKSRD